MKEAINQQLLATEQQLRVVNQQLEANNQQLIATEQQLRVSNKQLLERIKELDCFYGISKIVEIPDISLEEMFWKIIKLIPDSWQYTEIAVCRIILDGIEYKTHNFKKTKWSQHSDIIIDGKHAGNVEVCYLKKMPDSDEGSFLKEERLLLDALAERLGKIIKRKQAEEEVRVTNLQLEANNQQLTASEQQLRAANQQLDASNQQLTATEQQLRTTNMELSASERRFRKYFEQSLIGMTISSVNQEWIEINDVLCKMLGYTKKELFEKTWAGLTYPDDLEAELKQSNRMMANEIDSYTLEKRFIHKDGNIVYTAISVNAYRNITDNSVEYILALVHDITKSKIAEEALKKSEEQLRNIFENSTNIYYSHDTEHNITYISPQVEEILGYTQEEAMIKWTDLTSDNPINEIGFNNTVKAIETGKRQAIYELELIRKDGRKIIIEVRESPLLKDGKTVSIVGSLNDITERKKAAEALKESEKQLQILIDNMPDFVCFKDEEGRWLLANESAIQIFQIENIDYLRKKDSELAELNNNLRGSFLTCNESDTRAWNEGSLIHAEEIITDINGADRIYEVTKVPVFHADNKRKGLIIIGHDITERKQAEDEIKKLSKVVETTPDAVVISDIEGNIEYVNQGLLTLGGYKNDSLIIGKSIFMFSNEKGVELLKEEVIPTILSVGKWEGELFVKRKDNSFFPADFVSTVILNDEGKSKYLLSNYRNITERKQTEEALRDRERTYSTLINNLPGFAYRCLNDKNWTMNYISNGCEDVTGYLPDDFINNNNIAFNDIIDADYHEKIENLLHTILKNKSTFEVEYPIITKNKETKWLWERGCGIYSDKGDLLFLEGFITDVTERKQAEDTLIKRMNELEIFNEATVGRELKMIELKKEINDLLTKTGQKPKYEIVK